MYFHAKNRTDEDQMQAYFLLSLLVAPLFQSVWPMTQMNILSSSSRSNSLWWRGLPAIWPPSRSWCPPTRSSEWSSISEVKICSGILSDKFKCENSANVSLVGRGSSLHFNLEPKQILGPAAAVSATTYVLPPRLLLSILKRFCHQEAVESWGGEDQGNRAQTCGLIEVLVGKIVFLKFIRQSTILFQELSKDFLSDLLFLPWAEWEIVTIV